MGILKIDFIWYVKKISFLAFIGYIAEHNLHTYAIRHTGLTFSKNTDMKSLLLQINTLSDSLSTCHGRS